MANEIEVKACDSCPFNGVQIGHDETTCGLYWQVDGSSIPDVADGTVSDYCPLKKGSYLVRLEDGAR